ncbi:orexigenic neuropeptide QRFP-like [Polyodon spathula]|uniref:orexigenic neuropeptide QRFP-like n=1 Tax=Polyodon spathula TaxID=7913 RepID=UPI001B7F721D|nr:orexigenic neuropeptide QRFP-like [Polyodon spathula]XP_041098766.1 orexigenic neuropeptide QRFP-like [Polyodon spathula]
MKGACPLSILLLLELGSCLLDRTSLKDGVVLEDLQRLNAQPKGAPFWLKAEVVREKKSDDLNSLVSVAKELQGYGKERAGFHFRFGRGDDEEEEEEDMQWREEDELPGSVRKREAPELLRLILNPVQRRAGELESLSDELSGYRFRFWRK